MEGCHNNGNPADNRLSNLRWDTPANNCADKRRHGTISEKVTDAQVVEIRRLYSTGNYSQEEVGAMFGISQVRVSQIVSRGDRD